jgi:hypothetical protein
MTLSNAAAPMFTPMPAAAADALPSRWRAGLHAWRRRTVRGVVAALAALAMAGAWAPAAATAAETHALLMWVGRYGSPELNLPGIEADAARAREIATALGVPPQRRIEVSEEALTLPGIVEAFATLERRVQPGDRVLVYYSGHGRQVEGQHPGTRCSEGIVTQDAGLYLDIALERTLQRLAARAAQVLMFNDSCHAGGAATKSLGRGFVLAPGDGDEAEVPKVFPGALRTALRPEDARACGDPVNKSLAGLGAVMGGASSSSANWLYVAAAARDEIAYAGRNGSRATAAWHACLTRRTAQPGTQGGPLPATGEALRRCAQSLLDARPGRRQTVTLVGDPNFRLGWR